MMLIVLGVFCLSACGDKEEEAENQDNANTLCEGTWTGWTYLTSSILEKGYANDSIIITVAEDGSLTGVFKNATWGTATIVGINATQAADGSFTLTGGIGNFVMNNKRTGGTQEFSCRLESATLSADKQNLEANISANMQIGHGNMLFAFHTGEKTEIECVGTWTGWTALTTAIFSKDYEGDSLTISLTADGTLTGVFKNSTWGRATITGITATKGADGSYTLAQGEGTFLMNDRHSNQTVEFACTMEGATLSADKQVMKANISAFMETGHGNMLFAFQTGEKQAGQTGETE